MKKLIVTLALAVMPLVTFGQAAFDKFENVEGIESVVVNKEMFKMLGNVEISEKGDKADKYLDMVEKLEGLRVFTTTDRKHKKEMRNTVSDYLKQNPMDELMSVNSEGSKVKIYVKGGTGTPISEGLVFIEDEDDKEMVLVSFTGSINLNDLKGLN